MTLLTWWRIWRRCRCWGWRHCAGIGDHWPGVRPPHCTLWSPPPCLGSHHQWSHPVIQTLSTYAAVQSAPGIIALPVCAGHVAAQLNHQGIEPWPETRVSRPAARHDVPHLSRGEPEQRRMRSDDCVMTTSPGHLQPFARLQGLGELEGRQAGPGLSRQREHLPERDPE